MQPRIGLLPKCVRNAFTLVELLVVIAIIGVLVALLLPAVQSAPETSRRAARIKNMKQKSIASHAFFDSNGRFPPGQLGPFPIADLATYKSTIANHQAIGPLPYLLPFMEQVAVSSLIVTDMNLEDTKPYWAGDGSTSAAARTRIKTFACPSTNLHGPNAGAVALTVGVTTGGVDITYWDTTSPSFGNSSSAATILAYGRTSYLGVAGYIGNAKITIASSDCARIGTSNGTSSIDFEGILGTRTKTRFSNISDGSSNTLLFGECMGGKADASNLHVSYTWMGCGVLPAFPGLSDSKGPRRIWSTFNSDHDSGIVQFVLADGSVRRISPQVDFGAYNMLSGMHDGLQLKSDALQ